jgi:hypothetical protein
MFKEGDLVKHKTHNGIKWIVLGQKTDNNKTKYRCSTVRNVPTEDKSTGFQFLTVIDNFYDFELEAV